MIKRGSLQKQEQAGAFSEVFAVSGLFRSACSYVILQSDLPGNEANFA